MRFIIPLIFMNSIESEIVVESNDANMIKRPVIELIDSLYELNDSV